MKAWTKSVLVLVVGLGFGMSAVAQCQKSAKAEGGACNKGAVAKTDGCCAKGEAKMACGGPATAGMPAMYMKVGDQKTECPKEAATLAGGDEAKIRYIVAEKEYANRDEAAQVYQAALDDYLGSVTSVRYAVGEKCVACPDSAAAMAKAEGKPVVFRVASYTFADKVEAEKAATAAREAADKVVLKCVVDGKEMVCDAPCSKGAPAAGATCVKGEKSQATAGATCGSKGAAAQPVAGATCHSKGGTAQGVAAGATCNKDGKACEFVIGEFRTPCATTAQIMLVRSRINAAAQAAEQVFAQKNGGKEVAAGL